MRSAYEILGVARNASPEQIRRAFRALVRRKHPDLHGGSAEAHHTFLEIRAAHEILSDPERRAHYDRDPEGTFKGAFEAEQRQAQLQRRRRRLRKLYE